MNLLPMKTLLLDEAQGVLTITLNRPEVRNAMSAQMVGELTAVLAQAEATPGMRILVLRGAGGHFCAGGDLHDMAQARMRMAQQGSVPNGEHSASRIPDPIADLNAAFGRLCLAYALSPLAIVTVLEGTVMGGGFGLACVSDVSLASSGAVFRLPETSLGVIPAQIAPFLVERIGYAESKRLAITGSKVDAAEALMLRLVHEVHPDAEALQAALDQTVDRILGCAPGAIAATKGLLARARFEPPEDLVEHAAELFSRAILSNEGQEGTAAFIQKRRPVWAPPSPDAALIRT